MPTPREQITVDKEDKTLRIPHLGVSLRTLLGAAAASTTKPAGKWKIIHKETVIGTLNLKDFSS